ncbi:GTP pyrophosphokinase family protein [Vibrio gallaecicus]|uniref:GTP pyrophosphokinase n=1 Tax=Vibrio gallaecicus TaxID=552386 RepID=UPI0010C97780|nr:hypothetical protein [Vibrio gallaecicus]MDN3612832.1 hypothetical protein [Vibrio gallaecicus]
MNKDQVAKQFRSLKGQYIRLGNNIVDALKAFLDEKNIPYVDVYSRVKSFDSFYEKIDRKKYADPFENIEDICGVRVICYYFSDIEKINSIIKEEFSILESEDKSELLGLKEFAYRSQHFIIKLNENWLSAPNYRRLDGLKAEVQVRTILMHAWAEIEHKLNYKSDAQVPELFQRKLFRLSAKLEEADEQFIELKDGIDGFRLKLKDELETNNSFDLTQSVNLDSYITFIRYCMPNIGDFDYDFVGLSFDSDRVVPSFEDMYAAFKVVEPYIDEVAVDLLDNGYSNNLHEHPTEILGFAYDLLSVKKADLQEKVEPWRVTVFKWKDRLNIEE